MRKLESPDSDAYVHRGVWEGKKLIIRTRKDRTKGNKKGGSEKSRGLWIVWRSVATADDAMPRKTHDSKRHPWLRLSQGGQVLRKRNFLTRCRKTERGSLGQTN